MRTFETKKLFYNKHLYKIVFFNNLASFFNKSINQNNFSYARKGLDNLALQHLSGKTMFRSLFRHDIPISFKEFVTAKIFLSLLEQQNIHSYVLRTESRTISITSNDLDWLTEIKNSFPIDEWWEPNPDNIQILLNNSKIVLVNKPPEYLFKVYLKSKVDVNLANWLLKNKHKSKVGIATLQNIEREYYTNGNYFYIKDEKTLLLLQISFSSSIQKIEKLVYKDDVDKYIHGQK